VKSARLARPAGETGTLRPLGVRVGQHKTFTRLVFDWPAVVPYSLTETDRSVTVSFARSARINLVRLRRRLKGGLANPQASNGAGRLKFKIEKPAGQKVRHFLVGPKVVLDFKTARSVKRRMEASRKRPTRSRWAALLRAREKPALDSPIIRVKAAMVQPVPATSPLPPPRSGGGSGENLSMPDGFWSAMSVEEQIYGTE
jgi:hypothetical protein